MSEHTAVASPPRDEVIAALVDCASGATPAKVEVLAALLARFPQRDLPVEHHFADHVYGRVLHLPADTIAIGKPHKTRHLFILLSGTLSLVTPDGPRRVTGPCVLTAQPGQKLVYAHTDVVCMNVHPNPTNTTDLAAIEAAVIDAPALTEGDAL